ncbi:putative signal transducing protein [Tamlana flava]|uniref:putative signal transducing protein n=1 Tax=Tamlana flava TaxID=3158572 RepID=UPI00351B13BE
MPHSNYTKVYTGDYISAQRIVAALENEDIIAVVKEQTDSGLTSLFGGESGGIQQVLVHNDELEKALPIVENISSELEI